MLLNYSPASAADKEREREREGGGREGEEEEEEEGRGSELTTVRREEETLPPLSLSLATRDATTRP